jgi:hypothetical protein
MVTPGMDGAFKIVRREGQNASHQILLNNPEVQLDAEGPARLFDAARARIQTDRVEPVAPVMLPSFFACPHPAADPAQGAQPERAMNVGEPSPGLPAQPIAEPDDEDDDHDELTNRLASAFSLFGSHSVAKRGKATQSPANVGSNPAPKAKAGGTKRAAQVSAPTAAEVKRHKVADPAVDPMLALNEQDEQWLQEKQNMMANLKGFDTPSSSCDDVHFVSFLSEKQKKLGDLQELLRTKRKTCSRRASDSSEFSRQIDSVKTEVEILLTFCKLLAAATPAVEVLTKAMAAARAIGVSEFGTCILQKRIKAMSDDNLRMLSWSDFLTITLPAAMATDDGDNYARMLVQQLLQKLLQAKHEMKVVCLFVCLFVWCLFV